MLTDPVNEQPTINVRLKSIGFRGLDIWGYVREFSVLRCELVSKIHQCDGDSVRLIIQSPSGNRYAY